MKKFSYIYGLLFLFLFLNSENRLRAQVVDYYDEFYGYIANSNGRIVTTIKEFENSDEVYLEAIAIGYFHLGTVAVSLYYDPEVVYPIKGPGGAEITVRRSGQVNMGEYMALNPKLNNPADWRLNTTGNINPKASSPWTNIMTAGTFEISDMVVNEGEILSLFTLYFKKKEGRTLSNTTFSYYDKKSMPTSYNMFSLGTTLILAGHPTRDTFINSEMFIRRSPAKIATQEAYVNGTSVRLTGLATAEGLDRITGDKGLDWDNIVSTGFIYSKNDVLLTVDEYSNKINVDGVEYDFPNVADGFFTLGNFEFYMITNENTSNATSINMRSTIKNLDPGETYYAYTFMIYNFQTSYNYPVLGNQNSFEPEFCTPHSVVLLANALTNVCDGEEISRGLLLSLINKESGYDYLLFMDEECTEEFITSFPAHYEIATTHTFYVIAKDIAAGCTTDLEDALAITLSVNPKPEILSTSDTELYLEENQTFYLIVEVKETVEFQWYFEGTPIKDATQNFYTDQFNSSKEGTYTVSISNECATLYLDFHIYKALSIVEGTEMHYKLTVYPNPASRENKLYLFLEQPGEDAVNATAQIIDVYGKKIDEYKLTKPLTEIGIDMADGPYLIKVNTQNGKELVAKIIVQ